jgi:hypothetical protein
VCLGCCTSLLLRHEAQCYIARAAGTQHRTSKEGHSKPQATGYHVTCGFWGRGGRI